MKHCSKCKEEKPLDEFKTDQRRKNGRAGICKTCGADSCRSWRKTERGIALESGRQRNRPYRPSRYRAPTDKKRLSEKKWRLANPEKSRAKESARRAKAAGNGGRHTGEQIKHLLRCQRYRCAFCRASIRKKYHRDHIMPLALGGTDNIRNIQILCPPCNLAKRAKHPLAWARETGRLL